MPDPVTAIIGGSVLIGGGMASSAAAASSSAKAQARAQEANRSSEERQQQAEIARWHESRGSTGSAFLPEYMKAAGGGKFEEDLSRNMVAAYEAARPVSLEVERSQIASDVAPMQAATRQAGRGVADMFSGRALTDQIGEAQPVFQARSELAQTKAQAGLQALRSTLNEINAIQGKKGFTGDSLGTSMVRMNARKQAATDAAAGAAGVNLANAEDVRAMRNANRMFQVQNAGLANQMAAQLTDSSNLVNSELMNREAQRAGTVKSIFNIGMGQAPNVARLTPLQPIASGNQIAMQTLGSGMGSIGNLAMTYGVAKMMNPGTPAGTGAGSSTVVNTPNPTFESTYGIPLNPR